MRDPRAPTPVVILRLARDLFPHGSLAVVRSLGRLGIPVYGLHDDAWAPAAFSRYDAGKLVRKLEADSPQQTLHYLLELGHRLGQPTILLSSDDLGTLFIDDHADALAPHFVFPRRRASLSHALVNKKELSHLCEQYGVPTPRTLAPASRNDVLALVSRATFPMMVKSADPEVLHRRPQAKSTTLVRNVDELLDAYDRMEVPNHPNLILQEHIPGDLSAHWMMSGYYGPESECVVGFTGQKRRENKPGAGFTTLGVCVRNQEVESATNDFMKAIGYRGIVDAEWRYDARDRRYKLLDVNPRVGAQFRTFAGTNGLDVVRGLYLDLTGKPVQSALPDQGRTWMVEPYDVIAAFRYWRRRELTLPEWLRSLRGIHETAWFARDDPTPFWVMCVRFCWEMSRRAVAARRARARNQSRA